LENIFLKGLMSIHEKKIAHRDLKCENILIKGNDLKVSDFGFSKQKDNLINNEVEE
jgi:serine/threonine protein kinase